MSECRTPPPVLPFDEPERWLPVPGHEHRLEVSDQGRVRSLDRLVAVGPAQRLVRGRILSQHLAGARLRYWYGSFSVEGRTVNFAVHRLVLLAFRGPCPPGMEACHGPGGRLDNRLANLSWGTHVQNMADKIRDGTWRYGAQIPSAKLSGEDVAAIRRRRTAGETRDALAKEFGVHPAHVSLIANGKRWASDGEPALIRPSLRRRLPAADIQAIRARYAAGGVLQRELAEEYGVGKTTINSIIARRSYASLPSDADNEP